MKFLLLSENWREKIMQYYTISLSLENEGISLDMFSEYLKIETQKQEEQDETPQNIEQKKLSTFFDY